MSHDKQFTLYSHPTGPNGWKTAFILTELGLSYETIYLDFMTGEHKAPEYTKYNPNGRVPALIDHSNSDFVVWESNAIAIYLVDKYDTDHRVSASSLESRIQQLQWLFFQASGQGPYFGQGVWFRLYHPEKLPSAIERYQKEVVRVLSVLESVLSQQEWLVEGKCTVADLSFITWNNSIATVIMKGYESFDLENDFPAVHAWHKRLLSRDAVIQVLDVQEREAQKHPLLHKLLHGEV
ncbi:hypothetical protein POSPLADRAFT_1056933 [Postia placenta MAD-698-R-SB12]|uniref:glutathione transferase n=1 Tax=Postia placenta MAD-698-R-SB12 TaxID=670580 RepID=A0A1X6N1L3_9APHY|nr:hypothetical protein POSPLADRAFT_1056933 [Postia placenta MAD-698-R-SB12]OSX62343.1 hypothetical protein POSPLADRAFT_1056933 [Postia placenta MAD-698-R-SB12]